MLKDFLDNYPFGVIDTDRKREAIQFIIGKMSISIIQNQRYQAYALATIKHETADTYRPIVEGSWLGKNRVKKLWDYYKEHNPNAIKTIFPNGMNDTNYLGRGFVQLTHDYNYRTFSNVLRIDLVHKPELAEDPEIAWKILEIGMTRGLFTGKKLSDYFNSEINDWVNARRIINKLDKAEEIAEIAQMIYHSIDQIEHKDIPPFKDIPSKPTNP